MKISTVADNINKLYDTITQSIEEARNTVYRTANFTMVQAYWKNRRAIVEEEEEEEEQNGKERTEYGQEVVTQDTVQNSV